MSLADDDFGGFEEALPSGNTDLNQSKSNSSDSSKSTPAKEEKIPDWLLKKNFTTNTGPKETDLIKQLHEELNRTKEQLIDQQTNYLQLQSQRRRELEEKTNEFNSTILNIQREFQTVLKQALLNQREMCLKDFKIMLEQHSIEQERKFQLQLREHVSRFEREFNEKFENRLAEFQETLIKHNESEYEDIEIKVKKLVNNMFKERQITDDAKIKQTIDKIKQDLNSENEKHVLNCFKNQSEMFKEQIKSGILQEHLIHKDLINSKLEKLFKASEEKRRKMNFLFARHMSGLGFFVENSHKQLTILKDVYTEMVKNKELADYYGNIDETNTDLTSSGASSSTNPKNNLNSFSDFSLTTLANSPPINNLNKISKDNKIDKSISKDNLFNFDYEDDQLIDENLLEEVT